MNKRLLFVIFDIIFLVASFLFIAWLKPGTKTLIIPQYYKPFVFFLLIWVIASLTSKKYIPEKLVNLRVIFKIILQSNFASLAIVSILIYTFNLFSVSRSLLFGTIAMATFFEVFSAWIYSIIHSSKAIDAESELLKRKISNCFDQKPAALSRKTDGKETSERKAITSSMLNMISKEFGENVRELIEKHTTEIKGNGRVVATTTRFNITALSENRYNCIINLHRINDIRWLNKFFEAVNEKLYGGGVFIGKVETYMLRKARILRNYLFPINYIIYTLDFIFRRVFPKLPVFKRLYFVVTKGQNRLLSRAETLGRLYSCGFEVLEEKYIDDELYFVAAKKAKPQFPESPTYGPLVKLKRIGKDGKFFFVYKMRTMHPYSEYLQQYVYDQNNLETGGKFKDDFRVNSLGRMMRKVWLDELPMFINVFKGEMKIVGVRPLSSHYFELYNEELKNKRIKYKPGLVPPYYVDLPSTLEEIMESELRYLEAYEKNPIKTDFRYFFLAWRNILLKNARSK